MSRSYIHVFMDADNPDGDEVAFEIESPETLEMVIAYLQDRCKAVVPE